MNFATNGGTNSNNTTTNEHHAQMNFNVTCSASGQPSVSPQGQGGQQGQLVKKQVEDWRPKCLSSPPPKIPLQVEGNTSSRAPILALVININLYKGQDPRTGSLNDVTNIVTTLKLFGARIYLPLTENVKVTHKNIKEWIAEFKGNFIKGTTKACFVFMMGHGLDSGLFIDSRNEAISLEKTVFSLFTNQTFPAMINQPKIFFMNCCRGDATAPRVNEADAAGVADILIFWSTTPTKVSIRNTEYGALFIQHLCGALTAYAEALTQLKERAERPPFTQILQFVSTWMMTKVVPLKGEEVTQTPNLDMRGFGTFTLLLNDCIYRNDGDKLQLENFLKPLPQR